MKRLATLAAAALLWPGLLFAHGGGLDSSGCHRETATGGYHCHRTSTSKKKGDDVDWKTIGYVLGGAALVGAVLAAMDCDEEMSLRVAPYLTEEDETGLIAEYDLGNGQQLRFQTEHRMDGPQDETRLSLRWSVGF